MLASTNMMRGRRDDFRIISVCGSEFIECEFLVSDDVDILCYFKEIFKYMQRTLRYDDQICCE
jgi:hypothetical protein